MILEDDCRPVDSGTVALAVVDGGADATAAAVGELRRVEYELEGFIDVCGWDPTLAQLQLDEPDPARVARVDRDRRSPRDDAVVRGRHDGRSRGVRLTRRGHPPSENEARAQWGVGGDS